MIGEMDRRRFLQASAGTLAGAGLPFSNAFGSTTESVGQSATALPGRTAPLDMLPVTAVFASAIRADTGEELYRKDHAVENRFPASLVKLASALLIYQRKHDVLATETLQVEEEDIPSGQTNAGFAPGDIVTWETALHGLLIASAGDAAEAMARVIGREIHAERGSGTTGRARFVEEMNKLAQKLGLENSAFGSPTGVVDVSTSTAHDIARLARAAWDIPLLEEISGKAAYTVQVSGPNARTYEIHHTSKLVNGPYMAPAGIGVAGVVAAKTGTSGSGADNEVVKWVSGSGVPFILCVIDSDNDYAGYLDVTGTLLQIPQDFSEVAGPSESSDPDFGKVVLLAGAEGGRVDESNAARTLEPSGGARRSEERPLAGQASYRLNGVNGHLRANGSGLSLGEAGADFTIELTFAPDGYPQDDCTLISKFDRARNAREYELTFFSRHNVLAFFVSPDGRKEYSVGVKFDGTAFWSGGRRAVLLQRRDGQLEIFVNHDRIQGDRVTGSLHAGDAPLLIGCGQENRRPVRPYAGLIDEVRITDGVARAGDRARFATTGPGFPRGG